MKTFLQTQIASIVRFLLVLAGGWLTVNAGEDFAIGDPETVTLTTLLYGFIAAGLAWALKKIDGFGDYGKLASTLVGPRVKNIGWSLSRWVVGLVAGAALALVDPTTGELLLPDLGDSSIVGIVVVLAGFAYDRVTKQFKP